MSNFTLIIHPEDSTTDFLTKIYQNIENKILVHSSTNIGQLIHLIEAAHRVIMCGHGDQDGLIGRGGYIINEDLASSLRHKTNSIFLWCNAADFVMKHDICGIFSGMFISEVGEAEMFGIQTSQLQIDESNQLFSELLGRELLSPTCEDIVQTHTNIIKEYSSLADMGNIIAAYNCKRWYVRPSLSSDVKVHHQCVKSISLHSHLLTWSGGCRQGAVCDMCFYNGINASSCYFCPVCDWDVCESCLRTHDTNLVYPSPSAGAAPQSVPPAYTYPLSYHLGHLFITLPEGCFLVDTGCPISFGVTESGRVSYGTYHGSLPRTVGSLSLDSIQGLPEVRSHIVGVIGMDVMASQRCVVWDGTQSLCLITTAESGGEEWQDAVRVPFTYLYTYILIRADIMGVSRLCILDTGAQYGYVLMSPEGILDGATPSDPFIDYSPVIGEIVSESWVAEVRMSGVRVEERFGVLGGIMGSALRGMGVEAVIGVSWMKNKKVCLVTGDLNALYIL